MSNKKIYIKIVIIESNKYKEINKIPVNGFLSLKHILMGISVKENFCQNFI